MLHGDKNYLKASLTRGLLELQNRLIALYTGNLQAIGTQAALIGAFAFAGIGEIQIPDTGYTGIGFTYFYEFFIHATLCLSIFAVSQSTVVTIFGPSIALKGAEADVVLYVAQLIRQQRKNVLFIGAGTVTCIFCATIANFWAKIPPGVAGSATVIFFIGYCFIASEGLRCYNAFHPDSRNIKTKNFFFNREYKAVNLNDSADNPSILEGQGSSQSAKKLDSSEDALLSSLEKRKEDPAACGMIFWRQGFSDGGELVQVYAQLEKGVLTLFKTAEDASKPKKESMQIASFKMKDYKLSTNTSKILSSDSGIVKSLRGTLFGQDEFGVMAILKSSEYDLSVAVKKYRFVLLPTTISELSPLDHVELMCGNQKEYERWTKVFAKSIRQHSKLVGTSATDGTLSANDVEKMIISANIANI